MSSGNSQLVGDSGKVRSVVTRTELEINLSVKGALWEGGQRGKQYEGNTMPLEEILSSTLENLYQLQLAAVTNYHCPRDLNNRNVFSHNPGGRKSGMSFSGLKSVIRAVSSLEARGVSPLSALSSSGGCHVSWLVAASLPCLLSSRCPLLFCLGQVTLCLSYKDASDCIQGPCGPSRVISASQNPESHLQGSFFP